MKLVITNLKHFFSTLFLLLLVGVAIIVSLHGDIVIGENHLAYKVGDEGPHIFFAGDTIEAQYIRGNRSEGFFIEKQPSRADEPVDVSVHFPLDDSTFSFKVGADLVPVPTSYDDGEPIIAISDIEGNYRTFRDFLINNSVIDADLRWTFGKGHLVLVGDFVDRGASTTQVLWLIYKLEQEAREAGGTVHYILGNHEIKNLQGNFLAASDKYHHVAAMLGTQQSALYGDTSLIGRWMASKNTIERINGYLFTHGGLHPDLTGLDYSLDDINTIVRANYRKAWFPGLANKNEDLLLSTTKGPSWYRGYFKEDLTLEQVEEGLQQYAAKAIVVGHTLQWSVNSSFEGRVIGIDVKHPSDYRRSFPPRDSEGLLIKDGILYRALHDGSLEEL